MTAPLLTMFKWGSIFLIICWQYANGRTANRIKIVFLEVYKMNLNETIRKEREDRGYTQKQVAEYLGVDVTTYAHYEAGRRSPNAVKLKKLAELYGLNDVLLGASLPIVTKVEYDNDELQKFERELKQALRILEKGCDYPTLLSLSDELREAFDPIRETKEEALDLPELPMKLLQRYTGATVKKVYLNERAERDIDAYLKIQDEIYKRIRNGV